VLLLLALCREFALTAQLVDALMKDDVDGAPTRVLCVALTDSSSNWACARMCLRTAAFLQAYDAAARDKTLSRERLVKLKDIVRDLVGWVHVSIGCAASPSH
jgi:hypothetical protein